MEVEEHGQVTRGQATYLKLNDGEDVGDGEKGDRGGRPLAKAFGDRAHHFLQLGDVRV